MSLEVHPFASAFPLRWPSLACLASALHSHFARCAPQTQCGARRNAACPPGVQGGTLRWGRQLSPPQPTVSRAKRLAVAATRAPAPVWSVVRGSSWTRRGARPCPWPAEPLGAAALTWRARGWSACRQCAALPTATVVIEQGVNFQHESGRNEERITTFWKNNNFLMVYRSPTFGNHWERSSCRSASGMLATTPGLK